MKTNSFVTMAMAALLAAGCSQNEIMEVSPDARPAVGFSVFTDAQTRGTVTDNGTTGSGIKNATGFGVLAYYTGQNTWASAGASTTPNFMWNQQVTYASSAWTYTPVKFWPNTDGDKISFFAYAPYSNSQTGTGDNGIILSAATATSAPTLTFTVNTTPSKQVDLVATNAQQSTVGTDKTIDLLKTTGKVPFTFKHVLTRLNFFAKLAADITVTSSQTQIFIKSIKLLGTSAEAPASANNNSKFYSKATYQWSDGTWSYSGATAQTSSIDLDNGLLNLTTQNFGNSGKQYTTSSVAISSTTAVDLFKTDQSLFLIPPTDNGIETTDAVRVLLTYDVVTIDSKLSDGKSVVETKAVVSLPTGTMKQGTAYKYIFTIGLESVKVDANVIVWTNNTGDVAVPSADAANASAATIGTAITTLNGVKAANKNCNYFVVNVAGVLSGSVALTGTTTSFVAGDRIELKCTSVSSASVTLSGWTATTSGNSVILTKN